MSNMIKDGTGKGFLAKVDNRNRLEVSSTTLTGFEDAVARGNAFTFATNIVALTSGNESAILFLRNDGDSAILIFSTIVQYGVSTGGSGDFITRSYGNPTGGTIISTAAETPQVNLNATSTNTVDAVAFVGAEGATLTGAAFQDIMTQGRTSFIVPLVLPKGGSIGISMQPPTGTTAINVAVQTYIEILESN